MNEDIRLCVPGGVGDISWIYSKIKHLGSITGRKVVLYASGQDKPHRGGDFIQLLPEVTWGGYLEDRASFNTIIQSIPSEWPATVGGIGLFHNNEILNVAANIHLESGRSLSSWIPSLPTDYHYSLKPTVQNIAEAASIMEGVKKPVAVYVSNRSKEKQVEGGWNLWTTKQWIWFLKNFSELEPCEGVTFVFIGAEYDRDKTTEVMDEMRGCGHLVKEVVGKPLGTALECLRKSKYFFAYPSGIGILANVLKVPGVMLLPWILTGLEKSYADPVDLGYNRYKAWASPKPEQVLEWVEGIGLPMSLRKDWQ